MRRLLGAFTIVVAFLSMSEAQPPCNLTGGSVYVDHTSNPWMMNASVNGMSMYDVLWSNGSVGNQTQFYTNWCVSITDIISGCDTIICESCISDTLAVCPCPMIYSPVCGCDGNMYANDCIAICAGIYSFTPAIPNGTIGGFLPCNQPISTCEVEINGDSIICDWGNPQVLTASPMALSNPFVSYLWTNGQSNNNILTIISPGTYCVIATDATGCVDSACITVSVQEIPIFSAPSPPTICLGDSIVLEIDTVGLSNIIWVPNTLLTPPVHRIVDFPIFPQTYVVEAIDSSGCNRWGEIFVDVDSCILCIDSSLINPQIMCPMVVNPVCGCDGNTYMNDCEALNWYGVTSWTQGPCNPPSNFACMGGVVPGIATCVGPGNYAVGQQNVVSVYSTMAACIADSCNVIPPPPPCTVEINNGSVDIEMCDGDSVILEATIGFDTYLWTESSTAFPLGNTPTINVTSPGLYMVIATDIINNCVGMDSIQVIVYPSTPLNPITVPNPPIVCLGDSVVIEVNSGFLNYFWNTGNPLDEDENRVVVYPTQDFIYVVEALDINGCESREEIEVFVDTCASDIFDISKNNIQIYPNPASEELFINLNSISFCNIEIIDILGRLLIRQEHVNNSLSIKTIEFSKGTYFIRIQTHSDIQTYKIIIDR